MKLSDSSIREVKFKNIADYAIVNGVLEWIPEKTEVIVEEYLSKKKSKSKNLNETLTLRHDKTFINFSGICLYERFQRIQQKLREGQQACDLLFYVALQSLKHSFEIIV